MTDLQPLLDQLARSRPGNEQFATHRNVALFYSHGKKHGGWVYQVEDYANGERVPLESPFANERRFVTAGGGYWRYRFPFDEPPVASISALERQIAGSEFVAQGHALDPR